MGFFNINLLGCTVELSLLSIIIAFLLPLVAFYLLSRRPSGLPPFPVTPLPVVGNLLSLDKDPRAQFAEWRKKHGDVFCVYFGPRLVVVLNGIDVMKEALVQSASVFSDRPKMLVFDTIFEGKGILATSGTLWKHQRTFSLKALREFGFGRNSMERGILDEVLDILIFFESKKGEKQWYSEIFNTATCNVICEMLFGHRFRYDDPNFISCCTALNTAMSNVTNISLFNFFPILMNVPGAMTSANVAQENLNFFEEHLIKLEIERHLDEYDGSTPDFVAAYIKEIKDRENAGVDASELRNNFTSTLRDLVFGGTETTATTLRWLILFLIRFPKVQEKCFQEIQDQIGLKRFATLKDKPVLPYLEATIAETQRRSNIAVFSVMHVATEDTKLRGYNIPKDAMILQNMDSVLLDPKHWPEPDQFRPERFLDESGAFFKPESFIPFSLGRRVCMGESLAKMELFLFGAALIQNFKFVQPEDEPVPSLEPFLGGTAMPKPYKVQALKRFDNFPQIWCD